MIGLLLKPAIWWMTAYQNKPVTTFIVTFLLSPLFIQALFITGIVLLIDAIVEENK